MLRSELKELLEYLMSLARHMLAMYGDFHPFTAVMSRDGQITQIAADVGDHCSSSEHIQELISTCRNFASEGSLQAVGMGFDVRTVPPGSTEKTDAICIRLEHIDGEAVDVVMPYHKRGSEILYGQAFAMQGSRQVFEKSGG